MTFIQYWDSVRRKYPLLKNNERVTLPVRDLENLLRQAHEEGHKEGKFSKSIFEQVFGK